MVGVVIVSHSKNVAESVHELAKEMAKTAPVACTGGLTDGSFGSDVGLIRKAVESVYSDDGVVMVGDIGSSITNAKIVAGELAGEGKKVYFCPCPIVEGAIIASIAASCNLDVENVMRQASLSANK